MAPVLAVLPYIFWVILAIMILVFVHEMGHFLFAKLFRMRVDRFSVGFPPKIIGKKIGETEYVIGATPLGGYVKIAGMVDESLDADQLASEPQPWEFRAKPVWQRMIVITAGVIFNLLLAFVIFAGLLLAYGEDYIPAENIKGVYVEQGSPAYGMGVRTGDRILAVSGREIERYGDIEGVEALMADPMTITVLRGADTLTFEGPPDIMTQLNRSETGLGISARPPLVGGVVAGSAADRAGLRPGDRIVSIGGRDVRFWNEMTEHIQAGKGQPMVVRWVRPDSLAEAPAAVPAPTAHPDTTTAPATDAAAALPAPSDRERTYEATVAPARDAASGRYLLGISYPVPGDPMLLETFGVRHQDYNLGTAFVAGLRETWVNTAAVGTSLKRIVTGRENLRENVGGPIMIAKVTKQAADAGARVFWNIVAMLSITLAIMNILPIPALDGGHLVFLIYEGITRREPSLKVRMAMQQVGMILLLAFMAFVFINDFLRL